MKASDVLQAALATTGPPRDILLDQAKVLDLRERITACTACSLSADTTPVPWEGQSAMAIVGEAPGETEARKGRPFVGRAGDLLMDVIELAGFTRSDFAYINTICCRPPRNDYSKAESVGADRACAPNLEEQLWLSGAWLLIPVGNQAMWRLLPSASAGITQMRGLARWVDRFLVLPTFHPAYALRNPKVRDSMVQDFMAVKRIKAGIESAPVPKNYNPTKLLSTMREEVFTDHESKPVRSTFKKKGWVYAYSKWLEDTVILKRDDKTVVPSHVNGVQYTVKELAQLASMKSRTWEDARRLHYAKRELNAKLI